MIKFILDARSKY